MNLESILTYLGQAGPLLIYLAVVGALVLSGFGLPLPEDLPLIVGGYLSHYAYVNPWILFPACLLAIVGADCMIFTLGRRYGHHVPKLPLLGRYLTPDRIRWAERELDTHGGKFIFLVRFIPGFRTPVFFVAGVLKFPYWRFLLYDGFAAIISVPTIFFLAYYFAAEIYMVKTWITRGQLWIILPLVAAIIGFFVIKLVIKKRLARTSASSA